MNLMGLGLAKSAHVMGNTAQGATLGTPEYMAPEQVTGAEVSPATDLYALGAVAYELLTGQMPFRHAQPVPLMLMHVHLMLMHVQQQPVPPTKLRPELPEAFEQVVLTMMRKRPQERYTSATVLRAELAKLWPLALQQGRAL
nr:protein kinase [Corallococcus exiguus]